MEAMWTCAECRSVNRANDARCYKCRSPRSAPASGADPAETQAVSRNLPLALAAIGITALLVVGAIGTLAIVGRRSVPEATPSVAPAAVVGSPTDAGPTPTSELAATPSATPLPSPTVTPTATEPLHATPANPKPTPNIAAVVMAYEKSVSSTYQSGYFSTLTDLAYHGGCLVPGATTETCSAWIDYYNLATKPILAAFQAHLSYLKNHPAPSCLLNAYAGDRKVTSSVIAWITPPRTSGGESTPEGRQTIADFNALMASVNNFAERLPSYVSRCG